MKQLLKAAITVTVIAMVHGSSTAQAPDDFSFQGRLTDDGGNPVDTTVTIQSRLYKGGAQIRMQTHSNVVVENGIFSLTIANTDTIPFDQAVEIGITVGGEAEMAPRTPILMVPYAQSLVHFRVYPDPGNDQGPNIVGGATANHFIGSGTQGAAVLGGGSQAAPNTVNADYGTVAGGRGNSAGNFAGALSGQSNTASAINSVVAGGSNNTAGGSGNAIGGGGGNTSSNTQTTISGGEDNSAGGNWSTIGGGRQNATSAAYGVVSGGLNNTATALSSTVGGGNNNDAWGEYAVVPGGYHNLASGDYSFAAGERAASIHTGSFVWQDATAQATDTLFSSANYEFTVRAAGGFRFLTNPAPDTEVGAFIAPGGTGFSMASSKSFKDNFVKVDPVDYLRRLAAIDIYEWRMKMEHPQVTHVGPFAEDFYAAFGHGSNERTINSTDADGVALVAIQGLYRLVMEQAATIAELETRLERLE